MSDVLVLTNRIPGFFQKFSREIFGEMAEHHDVTYVDREESLLWTTVQFLAATLTRRPDVVWVAGSGFATFLVCLAALPLRNTTVIYYHNDFTYQHMRDFKEVPWLRLQIERIQEWGPVVLCDVVGTMTEYHEQYLRDKGCSKPFFRIPHGVNLGTFRPDIGDRVRADHGVEDDLVVGVVGTFNRSKVHDVIYGWTVLEALPHVESDGVTAMFVGGGDDLDYLERRAEELGVADDVIITGRIPHEELAEYVAALDIAVLVKPDHPADKMTTTMKLPEYLAAGAYIVADDHAFAATVLDADRASLLPYEGIRDESFPPRLAAGLDDLAANPDRVAAGAAHSREVAEERFDYDKIRSDIRERIEDFM